MKGTERKEGNGSALNGLNSPLSLEMAELRCKRSESNGLGIPGVAVPSPSEPGRFSAGAPAEARLVLVEVRDALPQRVCPGRGPVARRYRGKLRRRQAPVGKCRRSGARRPRACLPIVPACPPFVVVVVVVAIPLSVT